jgi:multifunctional methyltransferase subunit TRM112
MMRLLTHNVLRNSTAAAKGSNSPLRITATEVRVDEQTNNNNPYAERREVEFARNILPALNWETLIEGAKAMGLDSLPPSVTPELANDEGFLRALYHVLMDVHLIAGVLTCTETGREFAVTNGIVNMMLEENECEVPK